MARLNNFEGMMYIHTAHFILNSLLRAVRSSVAMCKHIGLLQGRIMIMLRHQGRS